jgi:hypothetical protein
MAGADATGEGDRWDTLAGVGGVISVDAIGTAPTVGTEGVTDAGANGRDGAAGVAATFRLDAGVGEKPDAARAVAANEDSAAFDDAGVTAIGSVPPAITITPPQTAHRARTPVAGTFAGSTRNTERQSEHDTVTVQFLR